MPRPVTPKLNDEKITRAALDIIRSGQQLRMSVLAKKLAVSPSSLYHHISGIDEIRSLVRTLLVVDHLEDFAETDSWEADLAEWMRREWQVLAQHTDLFQLLIALPVTEAGLLQYYSRLKNILLRAEVPEEKLFSVFQLIDTVVFGVALDSLTGDDFYQFGELDPQMQRLQTLQPRGADRNRTIFELSVQFMIAGVKQLSQN